MLRKREIEVYNRNTSSVEIKNLDYFNNVSFRGVESIEVETDRLYCNLKNGNIVVYSNIHGSWGFPTLIK